MPITIEIKAVGKTKETCFNARTATKELAKMQHPFQIVHTVQECFRGIAVKLAGISSKSSEWFSSHGREPRTHNPLQSGNLSAVDHFMKYCRQYEACEKGAGQMLSDLVHAALTSEFIEEGSVSIADVHKESSEAIQSSMDGRSVTEQRKEHLDAIGAHARKVRALDIDIEPSPLSRETRNYAKSIVANGRAK